MAGRGPSPKPAGTRQRRNRTSTAAKLSAVHSLKPPKLPDPERVDDEGVPVGWHQRTLAWWADIWSSPMAPEFLHADVHGLFLLAELEDMFHRASSATAKIELAKEIRLQRVAYGLTPIDRRRLQWEVDRGDEAGERVEKRKATKRKPAAADPRDEFLKRRQSKPDLKVVSKTA
jgi:hypothetical protein